MQCCKMTSKGTKLKIFGFSGGRTGSQCFSVQLRYSHYLFSTSFAMFTDIEPGKGDNRALYALLLPNYLKINLSELRPHRSTPRKYPIWFPESH